MCLKANNQPNLGSFSESETPMSWVSITGPSKPPKLPSTKDAPGDFEATLGYPSPVQLHLRNKIPTTSSMESAHSPGGKEDFYPLMGLDHDHLLEMR